MYCLLALLLVFGPASACVPLTFEFQLLGAPREYVLLWACKLAVYALLLAVLSTASSVLSKRSEPRPQAKHAITQHINAINANTIHTIDTINEHEPAEAHSRGTAIQKKWVRGGGA